MKGGSWRLLGTALAAGVVAAACWSTSTVERRDWGAIPETEPLRVTTTDGERYDLIGVTVYEDALRGVRRGAAADAAADSVLLPLEDIELIEVRRIDLARTALSAIAVGGAIGIVVALGEDDTRPTPVSSCPFVYSFDGRGYHLDSETYAGAAARGLDRTDVDNLERLMPVGGEYRLLLSNERPETQYTDELGLLVVDHRPGTAITPDRDGAPHATRELRPPVAARAFQGSDTLREGLVLSFVRPPSDSGLLHVTVRNTTLGAYALRTVLELRGDGLAAWYRQVARDESLRRRVSAWVMREAALEVSVLVGGQWIAQDALPPVGPWVAKTLVARLDLGAVPGDSVHVRLESAAGLWTLDRTMLGTPADDGILAVHPVPLRALADRAAPAPLNDSRRDPSAITARLSAADSSYHVAFPGDTVQLAATVPPVTMDGDRPSARTVLLRSRGFYFLHTRHHGAPAAALAERILSEPRFGNRYLLPRWRAEQRTTGPAEPNARP